MAARKRTWTPNVVRERIRTGVIVNRLQKFIRGEIEMSAPQVTAALGLLKKAVPDLSAVEHTGEMTHKHVQEMTDAELTAIATGSSAGASEKATGEEGDSAIH